MWIPTIPTLKIENKLLHDFERLINRSLFKIFIKNEIHTLNIEFFLIYQDYLKII